MVSELDAVRGWVCVQRACPKRGRQPSVAALRRQQLREERERQHDRRAHHTIDSRAGVRRRGPRVRGPRARATRAGARPQLVSTM